MRPLEVTAIGGHAEPVVAPAPSVAGAASSAWSRASVLLIAAVCVVAALAVGTRFLTIGDKALWLDETYTHQDAGKDIPTLVEDIANDAHPPGYFLLMNRWLAVAGDSETAMRVPSAIPGAAVIVLAMLAAWRIAGSTAGLLAGGLLILNPPLLRYAQEARMYPLVTLFALASTLALGSYLRKPDNRMLAVYIAAMMLLLYTHYHGFVAVMTGGLVFIGYALVRWRREGLPQRDRTLLIGGVVAVACIVVLYAPWWFYFLRRIDQGPGNWVGDPSVSMAGGVLRAALGLRNTGALWILPGLPAVALGAWAVWRRRDDPRIVTLVALAAAPIVIFVASLFVAPTFDLKRASPFIPPLLLLVSIGVVDAWRDVGETIRIDTMRKFLAQSAVVAVAVGLAAGAVIGMVRWYDRGSLQEWDAVVADAAALNLPVYLYRDEMVIPISYYDEADAVEKRLVPDAIDGRVPVLEAGGNEDALLIIGPAPAEEAATILAAAERGYGVELIGAYSGPIDLYRLTARR